MLRSARLPVFGLFYAISTIACGGNIDEGGSKGGPSNDDPEAKVPYCGPIPPGEPKIIGPLTGSAMNMVADADAVYWCEEESRHRAEPTVVRWDIATGKLRAIAKARCGALIGDGDSLLWSNSAQQLGRIAKDGSKSEVLFEPNLASGSAASSGWYDLAVDETHVYWSDFREAGGIYRGPKLGGTSELLSAERFPAGVAVDRDAVYWVSQGTGPKKRSKSTGETIVLSTTPATGGLGSPNLQLDREFVYWLSSRGIERTPKAGGENTLFVARASSEGVNNISIQAGCLYFNAGRKLYRRPLTTGDEILIATSTRSLNLFWFSANEKGAFWADWSGFDDKGTVNARAVAP